MKKSEVLEILDYKIVLEAEKEFPNEEVIAVLDEAMHLVSLLDNLDDYTEEESNVVCFNCGAPLKECCCDCPECDSCDECSCCKSNEDFELSEEEIKDLVEDVFTGLLEILINNK